MNAYFDSGVLLKLYTVESDSPAIQDFVMRHGQAIRVLDLHLSECTSAMRLKQFRRECTRAQANKVLAEMRKDLNAGVLLRLALDWELAWTTCRSLSDEHAGETGCRTLDALHVACALELKARQFITTDKRQTDLARKAGLFVINPAKE